MKKLIQNENNSIFSSKSNVLKFLTKKITLSKIEKIFDFTVNEWEKNTKKIINQILIQFPNEQLIIRSSAIGEDSEENSAAGTYESILNINSKSKNDLIKAINSVINSYKSKNNFNQKNQILVQTQTKNIIRSGVIFTRTSDFGSPYYVINYEDGTSTTGVTHGSINKTIKISKYTNKENLDKIWSKLLKSIEEVESIVSSDSLDIEFGITKKNSIILFQVRPITSLHEKQYLKFDSKIKQKIKQSQNKFLKLKKQFGGQIIFSDMTDWNPAEIIGNNPNVLDYSLYDHLIMKDAWHKGRIKLGYQKFNSSSLMIKFGNKPFVNVNSSFKSLIPMNIDEKLKEKLLKYYLKKLLNNPQLHDKSEFDILLTCYDISLKEKLNELKKSNFTVNETEKLHQCLVDFTQQIIEEFPKYSQQCNDSIKQMSKNRLILTRNIHKTKNYHTKLKIIESLLSDCKIFGTIPFSLMARIAFIGNALLKSFVIHDHLSQKSVEKFMNSLETPLTNFQQDLLKFSQKELTKNQFFKKYGHLRPGTYDVTVKRYDDEMSFLNDVKFSTLKFPKNFQLNFNKIIKIMNDDNMSITSAQLSFFIKNSLIMRENIKFEFSKNLSDALELIANIGIEFGFSRQDIAFLDIETIISPPKNITKSKLKKLWREKIKNNKLKVEINNYLILPSIISQKNDFEMIKYYSSKPNYITSKSITSNIINFDMSKISNNLENKIILLENADPGYDWIFTRNPAGLITKYGGVASHMSIRCSEIGLPAAIGCGEIIYEQISNASKIYLDCKNEQITILENIKIDEFSEQKKVLKSLGYIK